MKYIKLLLVMVLLLLLLPLQAEAAGTCGADLNWTLSGGTLTITGSGDMSNYTTYSKVPWYSQRKNIRTVELPEELTSISRYAFYGCSNLKEITIPDSVVDVGANAFYNCTALAEVHLGAGLTYIGDEAFFGCTALKTLDLPEGVAEIGYYAFANCTALEWIQVSTANPVFSSDSAGCLFNKNKTELLLAPSTLSGWYSIPDGVEVVADEAFFECVNLKAISVPLSLDTIGAGAFYLSEDLNHISYAGTAQQWGYISVFEDNDYFLQAETLHFEAQNTVYPYENCTVSGMYCDVCKDFIVREQKPSGTHVYSDYRDLICNSCDFVRNCTGLTLSQLPAVTIYTLGQQGIATEGGLLHLMYSDGTVEVAPLSEAAVSGLDTGKPGAQTITVQCMGQKTTYPVTVIFGTPDRLEITKLPNKLEYLVDGTISLSGLTLTVQYAALGSVSVTEADVTITAPDMTTPGKKTVQVWVGEKSVTFEITVHEKMLLTLDAALYPETAHNYSSNMDETQTLTWPGAESLILVTNGKSYIEEKFDYLYVMDGAGNVLYTLTGKLYNEVLTIPGDTVQLRLKTDASGVRYGYAFTTIQAEIARHSYENGYCTVCGCLQYKVAVCEKGVAVAGGETIAQAAALCRSGQYLKLYADARVELDLTKDLYIDLNGYDLTGTVTGNYKIYGMDSTTDTYSCNNIGYMNIRGGTPEAAFKNDMTGQVRRYVTLQTAEGYSFHRIYMGITDMTLRPGVTGVGYKAVFYADEMAAAAVDHFGYTMTLGSFAPRTVTKSGEAFVSGKIITLRIDHYDVAQFGQTALSANVQLTMKNGTVLIGSTYTMTFRGLLEQLNGLHDQLSVLQLTQIRAMIEKSPIIREWNVENLI